MRAISDVFLPGQCLLEIDHGHVIGAPVRCKQVVFAVTTMPEGDAVRVRKAPPCGVRREQRDRSRRTVRRYERNGKGRAWKPGITECELDLASKTASPSIDERDSVAAILGQVTLCIADDEHIRKQHESYGAEVTTIDMPHESLGRVVVLGPDHLPNIHDGDVPASAVLEKLVIVNASVVIDDIGSPAIFAHHDVRRISERPSM